MGALETLLIGATPQNLTITKRDIPLVVQHLQKALVGTDYLGRTNSVTTTEIGTAAAQWLHGGRELTTTGYAQHAVAYSIVTRMIQTGAAIPWGVYKLDSQDRPVRDVKHPLNNLLYRPNPRQSWSEFLTESMGYELTLGNDYTWGIRPDTGPNQKFFTQLWNLPASKVKVLGGDFLQEVDGYEIHRPDGQKDRYEPEDILHLKYWSPEDARYGLSPLGAGIKLLTSSDSGLNSRVRQYQNQGPPGIIYQDTETPPTPWSPEQAGIVRRWFNSFRVGGRQDGEMPIVGNKVGFLRLGLSPVDLDVLQALQADTRMICNLFGFPAELLNDKEASTYNNVEAAYRGLYTNCVIPMLRRRRDGLNRWLSKQYKDECYIDFDLSGIPELQTNKKELAEWLGLCHWVPLAVKNEIMGLPADPNLSGYLIPSTLTHVQSLAELGTDEAALKLLERANLNDYA